MKTQMNFYAGSGCSSHDLLAAPKPRRTLEDGSSNPAYWRWYYQHNKEKKAAQRKKYRQTEKGRAQIRKWNQSEAAKVATAKYTGKRKCVECGIEYRKQDVDERGYRKIGRHGCICDLCS
jgi:hypothetical protein